MNRAREVLAPISIYIIQHQQLTVAKHDRLAWSEDPPIVLEGHNILSIATT